LYVHALNQSGRAEVLSAPKVVATSGQTANIRMVRMEYYPESWTDPDITVTESLLQFTPSYPELGEATNVGINLEVTPTVSPNNYTISLQLNPSVIERTGWTDYSYIMDLGVRTGQVRALQIMPEISRRDITTTVRVYDGEMLVLGGMLRDEISAVDDRIPLLSDIPLLGRLARTKNESSEKINLMIFVTARLVNPDGLPVRVWDDTKGLPDFRRL
jgi:general secretion pathway protein D